MAVAVAAAVWAPSQHNTQPWRFRLVDGAIEVWSDPARRLPVADPGRWAARIGCGAALGNARLALAGAGRPADLVIMPSRGESDLVARLTPGAARAATPAELALLRAVPRRRSTRGRFSGSPVPAAVRARMLEAVRSEGCWLDLIVGTPAVTAVAEIAHSADRVLRRDERYRAEIEAWTRPAPAIDGVPSEAAGPKADSADVLPRRDFGGIDTKYPAKEVEPLVAVLGTPADSAAEQVTAGQALQKLLLTVTDAGLASSLVSQPIEVPAAREQLRLALGRHGPPQMVVRIGYAAPGAATPRRPAGSVIVAG
ncbi:Acg family FMN-binding oxidoreductase [Catenuloplanes sp. NPDC051500]|uniref:Acg family FMN-binding oxidoreductase n=1 Tax=Catenuloplanes sp. NPDC051500 TaxID=3363959 RepID=UPI0037A6AC94